MKFPNAYSGVRKLYAAEIIQLIALLMVAAASGMGILFGVSAQNISGAGAVGAAASAVGFVLVSGLLFVLGAVFSIIGLVKSGRDDHNFKIALYMVLIGVIASIVGMIYQNSNSEVYNVCDTISKIGDLGCTLFIIQGLISLSDKLGKRAMVQRGQTIFKVILAVYVFSIIGNLSYTLVIKNPAWALVGTLLLIVSVVLSLVYYILFLSYLSKARRMLAA